MSISFQGPSVVDVTVKLELAERVSGHAGLPSQALRALVTGSLQAFESVANQQFDEPLKERVWNKVSSQYLKTIKEYFLLEFCNKIFAGFSDSQMIEMLEEHKRNGIISPFSYGNRLNMEFLLHKEAITNAVTNKVMSLADDMQPILVKAVLEEGVILPIAKKD